jgi:protein-S-isoprenylcysteine O-methyltransferase Ste14
MITTEIVRGVIAETNRTKGRNFFLAIVSAVFACLLVVTPMAFVRGINSIFVPHHHQEVMLVQFCIVISFLSGLLGFRPASGVKEDKKQRRVVWTMIGFVFLYISCAVLCEKLKITVTYGFVRDIGLVLVAVGGILRIWSIAVLGHFHSAYVALMEEHKLIQSGPYRSIRNPSYLGMLIVMAGIPLVYGTWFPLLAIPGAFIVMKWRMNDEEAFLAEHFGEEYENYCQKTVRLIPFIY